MKICGTRFGEIEVDERKLLTVVGGLCGFESYESYALITPPELSPYAWLQSVDRPALAFVVTDTSEVCAGYSVSLTNEEARSLRCDDGVETVIMALVTIPPGKPEEATANLQAPLVINPVNRLARQVILEPGDYSTRYPLHP